MQTNLDTSLNEIVPFTLDDLRREQSTLKDRLENLRRGFFSRYTEWEKECDTLKRENKTLRDEIDMLKGSRVFMSQELMMQEFNLDAL